MNFDALFRAPTEEEQAAHDAALKMQQIAPQFGERDRDELTIGQEQIAALIYVARANRQRERGHDNDDVVAAFLAAAQFLRDGDYASLGPALQRALVAANNVGHAGVPPAIEYRGMTETMAIVSAIVELGRFADAFLEDARATPAGDQSERESTDARG